MARGKGPDWDDESRKTLETLAKEGYNIPYIAKRLGVSHQTVRSELMRGMDEESYRQGRYLKYSAQKSVEKQVAAYEKKLRGYRDGE